MAGIATTSNVSTWVVTAALALPNSALQSLARLHCFMAMGECQSFAQPRTFTSCSDGNGAPPVTGLMIILRVICSIACEVDRCSKAWSLLH